MFKESKIFKIILVISFMIIEAILLSLIVFVNPPSIDLLCYIAVVVAFIYSLTFTLLYKKSLKIIAIICTLLADLFLVLLRVNNYQIYGMIFFLLAQSVYAIYLFSNYKDHLKVKLIIRIVMNILLISIMLIVLKKNTDLLSIISIIYFANLISSIIICSFNIKNEYLFLAGLCTLLLCDIHVGLVSADGVYLFYKPDGIINKIIYANFNYTWFFYIFSLVFISYSIYFNKVEE